MICIREWRPWLENFEVLDIQCIESGAPTGGAHLRKVGGAYVTKKGYLSSRYLNKYARPPYPSLGDVVRA